MNVIVIKKSSFERVITLFCSEPSLLSSVVRVEKFSDSVYLFFDSLRDLFHASTVFYVDGILHRCTIRK